MKGLAAIVFFFFFGLSSGAAQNNDNASSTPPTMDDNNNAPAPKPFNPPHLNATQPVVSLDQMGATSPAGEQAPATGAQPRSVKVGTPAGRAAGVRLRSVPGVASHHRKNRCPAGTQPTPDGKNCWEPAQCPPGTVMQGDRCGRAK